MFWPMLHLFLAFAGVAVLGVLAVRVALEVRRLAKAVGDGAERIALAAEDLERAALPLAGSGGRLRERRRDGRG
ncbi:hypothetical protein [Streptomyces sp. YIM 98790]|uniref:hypothetical protein n=1 Tax=Streptomyces sp. YIM 98790 TaxID=2689077 RepID=UPI001407FC48|nr:hypothetical protein [Streptomyces sp. YIM 98790]